jgi:hypothetical protein
MTRAKLIESHGKYWGVYARGYGERGDERPCEDCGSPTITRARDDADEVVCGDCATWRLGFAEGKRQALAIAKANKSPDIDPAKEVHHAE